MVHDEGPVAAELMPKCKSCTDRTTRISRSRLDVDTPELRRPTNLAISDGVHGAAPGKRQIR